MAEETLCPKCNAVNSAGTLFCAKCGTATGAGSNDEKKDPFIGTFVGERFLVKRQLGEGGMGVVYEAEQTAMDRKVALKVLHPHLNDDELYARFRNEAASSSKLEHPNIITVYDFGRTENDSLYIAMEYIDGKSLDDEIKQNGAMDWRRACKIGSQICSALRNAHEKSIIHRDMKPENVMLCKRGDDADFVKVLDFGIAKLLDEGGTDQRKALTKTGMVFGTPQYMSPEQVRGDKIDARSDIYSVGIIVYEMLTGVLPFNADTPMGLLTKHLLDAPPAFSTANPNVSVPVELEALVMAAMAKSADSRPQTMKEFGYALDGLIGVPHSGKTTVATAVSGGKPPSATASAVSATMPMPAQSVPSPVVRGKAKSSLGPVIAGVAVLLMAGAGAAWYFMLGPGKGAPTTTGTNTVATEVETIPTAGDSVKTEDNTPPGPGDIELPPGPESLAANPGGAEVGADAGPSGGRSGSSRIGQAKQLVASGAVSEEQLKNVKVSDDTKKKIQEAAQNGKVPDGVELPPNVTVPDDLKQKIAEKLQGAGDGKCIITSRGGENANSIARALKRKQAAIKNCIEDGSDSSAFSFSVSDGKSNLSGVSATRTGNSAQAGCLESILSGLRLVSAVDGDQNGTVTFTTQKSGDQVSRCQGLVKM